MVVCVCEETTAQYCRAVELSVVVPSHTHYSHTPSSHTHASHTHETSAQSGSLLAHTQYRHPTLQMTANKEEAKATKATTIIGTPHPGGLYLCWCMNQSFCFAKESHTNRPLFQRKNRIFFQKRSKSEGLWVVGTPHAGGLSLLMYQSFISHLSVIYQSCISRCLLHKSPTQVGLFFNGRIGCFFKKGASLRAYPSLPPHVQVAYHCWCFGRYTASVYMYTRICIAYSVYRSTHVLCARGLSLLMFC